ncbi:MAG: TipAS antibiotic-recognition domain-containing protein [Bacillota bacterium]
MDRDNLRAFDMEAIKAHQEKYTRETFERYGESETCRESQRRTAGYSREDWARIQKRGGELFSKIASLMDAGPGDARVQRAVAGWRQHITDSFYDCTPEIFMGLGELYVSDPRFTQNIDAIAPGLSAFLREAIQIYCNRLES